MFYLVSAAKHSLTISFKNAKTILKSPFFSDSILVDENRSNLIGKFITISVFSSIIFSFYFIISIVYSILYGLKTMFSIWLMLKLNLCEYFCNASIVFEIPTRAILSFFWAKSVRKSYEIASGELWNRISIYYI